MIYFFHLFFLLRIHILKYLNFHHRPIVIIIRQVTFNENNLIHITYEVSQFHIVNSLINSKVMFFLLYNIDNSHAKMLYLIFQ